MIYLIVLFFLVILTIRYDINRKKKNQEEWYIIVYVIFVLIAGLRYRLGEDTINYIYYFYHATPVLGELSVEDFLESSNPPLWFLLNSFIKTIGGKFFCVQIIQSVILNGLLLKYFKKHSPYPFACATLYFFWRYQWYNMVVMKAGIALAIILFANDYFLEKKYKKGIFLVLLASGFHQSSILLVVTPFLMFIRFNTKGLAMIVGAYVLGAILQSQLGDVFDMMEFSEGISNKLDNYQNSKYMRQDHNINYFIFNQGPLIIYPVLSLLYLKKYCKESKILSLEPFLVIGLLFQAMVFNIWIFYRFVYIYLIYYIIFIVEFFIEYSKRHVNCSRSLAYMAAGTVFIPLIINILYFIRPFTHEGFNPYSSVIERSVDRDREHFYSNLVAHYWFSKEEY